LVVSIPGRCNNWFHEPIMIVHGFPERIITRIEGTPLSVELVAKYEIVLLAIMAGPSVDLSWRIWVNESGKLRELGNLPRCVDAADVIALDFAVVLLVEEDDGVTEEEHEESQSQNDKCSDIHPTSPGEGRPAVIVTGIRVVECVIKVGLSVPHVLRDGGSSWWWRSSDDGLWRRCMFS